MINPDIKQRFPLRVAGTEILSDCPGFRIARIDHDIRPSEAEALAEEIVRRVNLFDRMLVALKDAYPFISDDQVRAQVGNLIVKAEAR